MFLNISQRQVSFLITGIFFVFVFFGFISDANAAITRQAASGPWTGIQTGYTGSPDLQFYSPKPPLGGYSATYNYGCQQDGAGNLECHKMFPSEDTFNTYTCGNTTTSPANLVDLGSAWLFNNCVFSGDNTPPGPPPVVTLFPISSSQINVSWTPSSDSESGMAFYRVYRFQGACCSPIPLTVVDVPFPQTTYAHTGLSANTWYGYYVVAYDNAGKFSSSTGTVYAQTLSDSTAPTDPSGLNATPASTSQINLLWTASIDPGPDATGIGNYRIERCTGMGCTSFVQIAISTAVSYSDTGLSPSTTYTYRVRAYDNAGNPSNGYATDFATTLAPPDNILPIFPANALSGTVISSTQINLTWLAATDNVGVVSYQVYRDNSPIAMLASSVFAYSDTGLSPSTTYNYFIRARDAAGNQRDSNILPLTTDPLPDIMPPSFSFTSPNPSTLPPGTTSALLAGTTMTGPNPEQAICRYDTSSTTAYSAMTSFSETTLSATHSITISGLSDGSSYTFYVKCSDAVGNISSAFSYMFSVMLPAIDTIPPHISNPFPVIGSTLVAGTTNVIMSVSTDEDANCRYNQGTDIPYGSMTGTMGGATPLNHSTPLTGLINGMSYVYFIRCQDTNGNTNTSGFAISFSVASPVNQDPIALISMLSGVSGTVPFAVSADGSGSYDNDGIIVQYVWIWGDSSPNTIGPSSAAHTYTIDGTYTMTLQVIDNHGGVGEVSQMIIVSVGALPPPPPPPPIAYCSAQCIPPAACVVGTATCPGGALCPGTGICPDSCAPTMVCSLSGVCVAPGSASPGPVRTNGYLSLTNGAISNPSGVGAFPSNTTALVMSLETDVNAECQYTLTAGESYDGPSMKTFLNTGTTKHAVTLTGITSTLVTTSTTPKVYTYYVWCKDLATGAVNQGGPAAEFPITFTISGATVVSGPDPYTCLINKNFVKNNIPYIFDVCIPR